MGMDLFVVISFMVYTVMLIAGMELFMERKWFRTFMYLGGFMLSVGFGYISKGLLF